MGPETKLAEWMDALQKATQQAAPQVIEAAMKNQVWAGIGAVAVGLFFLSLTFIFGLISWNWFRRIGPENNEAGVEGCFGLGFGGAALVSLLISACTLLNPWNWCAIYDPKTALFHDVFYKLMNR